MTDDITLWIAKSRDADEQAAQAIWEEYFERLTSYARRKLSSMPRRSTDEEDIAVSAMNSFFQGMKKGRFLPSDRDELWRLLTTITVRKATAELRKHYAQKRGRGVVRGESVFEAMAPDADHFGINEVMGENNLGMMSEKLSLTCTEMLDQLQDEPLRSIATLRLEGFSSQEIAEKLGVSLATIKRKLARIREIWS